MPFVWLLTLAIMVVGANSLALSAIAVSVARSFAGASAGDVLLASALFGGGTALAALFIAPHIDRFGPQRALVWALGGLSLALMASALAPHLALFLIVQALAGLASGVALPATYALATSQAPAGQGSVYLGKVLTGWTLSLVFGVFAAGIIAEFTSWRVVYAAMAAGTLAVLTPLWRRAPAAQAASAGTTANPFQALTVRGAWRTYLSVGLYMFAFYGLYSFLGTHLQKDLGLSAAEAGAGPALYGLGFGLAVMLDRFIDRWGAVRMAPLLFGALAGIYAALAGFSESAALVLALCFVWGAANHVGLNLLVSRVAGLDPEQRGALLGFYSAVTYAALLAGVPVMRMAYEGSGFALAAVLAALAIAAVLAETAMLSRGTGPPRGG